MIDLSRQLSEHSVALKEAMKSLVASEDYELVCDVIDYTDIDMDCQDLSLWTLAEEIYYIFLNSIYTEEYMDRDGGLGISPETGERIHPIFRTYIKNLYQDIVPDSLVCLAYFQRKTGPDFENPYDLLEEWTGQPFHICYSAMLRADMNDLIEWGVSLRTGWLSDRGKKLLEAEIHEVENVKTKSKKKKRDLAALDEILEPLRNRS
jgi:hypothetical protein